MTVKRWTLAGLLPVLLAAVLLLPACAATPAPAAPGSLKVLVAFYPFEFVASRVGGDKVVVTNLTQPGAEPHDLELAPRQVAAMATADLVVYQSGFQPAVDEAIAQAEPRRVVDTAAFLTMLTTEPDGTEEAGGTGARDPHTWLDPTNLVRVAERVRAELSAAAPESAATFDANAAALIADLTALDRTISTDLAHCAITPFITSHAAFGYLAARYGLTQVGIRGLEPDVEPGASRIAEVQRIARDNHVTTIFFETLVSPVVAESIAGDLGLRTDVLDPLEGITADSRGSDYLEVMAANAASLKESNQCS